MILTIDLRPEDANGAAADLLQKMGAKRATPTSTSFLARIPFDPNLPDDYILIYPYTEALLDVGVMPLRLRLDRAGGRPTPVTISGSAGEVKSAYKSFADQIRKLALQADAEVLPRDEAKALLALAKQLDDKASSIIDAG